MQELDPRETGVTGRLGRRPGIQKYRDCIRRVVLGARFVLIGLEHRIRSTMPCRCGLCCRTRRSMTASCARIRRANRRVGGLTRARSSWEDLRAGTAFAR